MNKEETDIQFLPGVGPSRKKILSAELGIATYGDLLMCFPYKYVDRSHIYTIREVTGEMPFVQICGRILSFETFEMGPRKERVVAHFSDGTGIMDLVWFNGGQYAKKTYKIGTEYVIFGRPPSSTDASMSIIPTSTPPTLWNCRQWACSPTTPPPK